MELTTIRIAGMQNEQCAQTITQALTATKGVEQASVSFTGHRASVGFNDSEINLDQLKQVIRDSGFDIQPAHGEEGNCCGGCGS